MTVTVDDRGRVSLGKLLQAGTYRATSRADGSVLLEPAVVMSQAELALLRHPEVDTRIEKILSGDLADTAPYVGRRTRV